MPRGKVKLSYIINRSIRRSTFLKRCDGLIKKLKELTILCSVRACAVIYQEKVAQPLVWPNEFEARQLLHGFRSLPGFQQSKKTMSQEMFLRRRITKLSEQLIRVEQAADKAEMTVMMYESISGYDVLGQIGAEKALQLSSYVDQVLKEVRARIEKAKAAAPMVAVKEEDESWIDEMVAGPDEIVFNQDYFQEPSIDSVIMNNNGAGSSFENSFEIPYPSFSDSDPDLY